MATAKKTPPKKTDTKSASAKKKDSKAGGYRDGIYYPPESERALPRSYYNKNLRNKKGDF